MRNITENFSPHNNFWDFNQQFKIVEPFKSFYNKDRTKDRKKSSDIMWGIALMYHPESDIYDMSDKEERVARDMLKFKKGFKWDEYQELIDAFIDMALTQAQKSLRNWELAMKDRDDFLATQKYHFGYIETTPDGVEIEHKSNVKELDEMRGRTIKLYQDLMKIQTEMSKELVARGKGSKIKSMTDEGLI